MTAVRRAAERRGPPPLQLRFQSGELPVELYGDFVHWLAPQPLQRRQGAEWAATLALPSGVYSYKFRTYDGRWHLDPDNLRTRATDGNQNSLLVVGGCDEPLLHAPSFPLLFLDADGKLTIRAGLRRGHGRTLTLRCLEPDASTVAGDRDLPMTLLAEEDEHLLFEVEVPTAAPTVDYLFLLESGRRVGSGGQALRARLAELGTDAPSWWRQAVLYTIFVDRFRRGSTLGAAPPLTAEQARWGGDLDGVREALPYLADLGVTVLHLTPLSQSPSAHRYDATNPLAVDPALGGERALAALLEAAHQRGLRILLDVVLTHVHRDFLPFCDVRLRGRGSPWAGMFALYRHPFSDGPDPGYRHYQKGQWQEPLLRTDSATVAEYLEGVVTHYAQLGVDGFRLDAAADVPLALLLRLRAAARAVRPDALLLGEVTPDNLWRYTAQALDAATDFGHQQALYRWLWRRQSDGSQTVNALGRRAFARGPGWAAVAFTATHDQPRFLTLSDDLQRSRLAHLLTLLGPAIPAIYYGDEVALRSRDAQRDFEDAWPDRAPMPWEKTLGDDETLQLTRRALLLRRRHPALHRGTCQPLSLPADASALLAFSRRADDELIEIYANGSELPHNLELPAGPSAATLLLSLGEVALAGQRLQLGALAVAVVARQAAPALVARFRQALDDNRQRASAAAARGEGAGLFLPSQLYLTVTERCNLRCRHCITEAPERTASGRARTLQPWLLERLSDALAAADYFGFVHGGESLVAPILFDVLVAIKRARGGRPYQAHLLSNGMLLRPAMVERLVEQGLSSLAVSIDGGSAASNDGLRLGADFAQILDHIAAALALRDRLGIDLRLGVSTVLTQSNVGELVQLGERLAALGVDWIKVEELYPVNPLSLRERIEPRQQRAREAVAGLRAAVAATGMVVVDHLAPPAGCLCEVAGTPQEAAWRAFRVADDFANRAQLVPCQVEWQQACIDPDGTVHPGDYFQPAIGSLDTQPLLSLWQGEAMQRRRAAELARRVARGIVGCRTTGGAAAGA